MLFFHVTPCLRVAAQPCMEWIPIKKRPKTHFFADSLNIFAWTEKSFLFFEIDLLPWILYKQQLGQILVWELWTIFQKIYVWVFPSVLKRYKEIWLKSTLGSYLHSFYAFIYFYLILLCIFIKLLFELFELLFKNDYLRLAKSLLPPFFIPGNNKYYTTILINSSYPLGHNLLILRVTLFW